MRASLRKWTRPLPKGTNTWLLRPLSCCSPGNRETLTTEKYRRQPARAQTRTGSLAPVCQRGLLGARSPSNLDQHIHSIKPGKAVPEGAASWCLCSKSVASAMIRHLEGRQAESGLDDGLTNADLCLIPKPGKPADKPSNLRPLPDKSEGHSAVRLSEPT